MVDLTPASPLAEADPNSIQHLMDKDPLLMTNEDVEAVVTALRAGRAAFKVAEAKPKRQPKQPARALSDILDLSTLKLPE